MALEGLRNEHPTLTRHAEDVIHGLSRWSAEVRAAPGGSVWLHHTEFAERTEHLAGHLAAVLDLAESGRFASAMSVARTALEHHVIDRLLLLADSYVEVVRPDDLADIDRWEHDWAAKTEPWTRDVRSVERTKDGKALRLVRSGHSVRDETGHERERISPYWVTLEHHDAFLGHPNIQPQIVRPFDDPDERVKWARRNQTLYSAYLKWSSLCGNLELNNLATPTDLLQIQVHYAFLSAFTHATKSGYDIDRRASMPNGPSADHVLGELALLYAAAIAGAQADTWDAYTNERRHLLLPLRPELREQVSRLHNLVAYFWFLGGSPQQFDYYQEANRRARPALMAGGRPEVGPTQLRPEQVGYYANPFDRLRRLHVGEQEITTGFSFSPMWSALHW